MRHESQGGLLCIHCHKPLSQWRAGEECSGHVTIALRPETVRRKLSETSREKLIAEAPRLPGLKGKA